MAITKIRNPETGEWERAVTPSSGVNSFNGRNGDVVPQAGDYTAEMVGAAPGGFGWGTIGGKDISGIDPNTVLENGFYVFGAGHANYPTSVGYSSMLVLSRNENYSTQILFQSNAYGAIGFVHKRVKFDGAWYPWERIH